MTFILWVSGVLFDPRLRADCTCGSDTDRVCEVLESQVTLAQRDAQNVLASGKVYIYCPVKR